MLCYFWKNMLASSILPLHKAQILTFWNETNKYGIDLKGVVEFNLKISEYLSKKSEYFFFSLINLKGGGGRSDVVKFKSCLFEGHNSAKRVVMMNKKKWRRSRHCAYIAEYFSHSSMNYTFLKHLR